MDQGETESDQYYNTKYLSSPVSVSFDFASSFKHFESKEDNTGRFSSKLIIQFLLFLAILYLNQISCIGVLLGKNCIVCHKA